MIAIPCHKCNHMIDIDTQVEPIKVPCYLLLCRDCQIQSKINERNIKLNKVLNKGLKERIKVWLKS
jgi:DNA-directed RNA polymerase subunit M/transcription elongation factor TFIIS